MSIEQSNTILAWAETAQQAYNEVRDIMESFYTEDTSVRRDPMFRAIKAWLVKTQAAIDAAQDAVTEQKARAWEAPSDFFGDVISS